MKTTSMPNPLAEQDVYAFPVSFAQQRLWFLDQLNPQSATYNQFSAVRISIPLNIEALEQSIQALVQRHEALRTCFVVREGQPLQMIVPHMPVPLVVTDLEHLPETQRETEMLQLANKEVQQPFHLTQGPLFRTMLFRLGAEEYLLLLTIHHIIYDAWSEKVFFHELATLYQGFVSDQPTTLAELPIQYVDYSIWQREQLQGKLLEEQLAYWKKQLADAPALLELPSDRPRPALPTFRGSIHLFRFPTSLTDSLKALSRQEGVSLFTILVASFQILLYRYTGQVDLLLGTDTANRDQAETEELIGFFVNTLVLRCDLSGNPTFRKLLERVRTGILGAFAHQDIPFEYLAKELQPNRSPGQNPFFQVMLSLDLATSSLPLGWVMTHMEIKTGASKFDLSLEIQEQPEGGYLEYNTDLFNEATIVRMISHWERLLEGIVADPTQHIDDLPLLSEADWQQQVVEWNASASDFPHEQCFHQLFEAQVRRTPEAIAAVDDREQLTYEQLNQRANYLAHLLQARGVGPETIVALLSERGIPFLTAVLAVFKAGGAYLPLDPHHPPSRIRHILEHSDSHLVLAAKGFTPLLSQVLDQQHSEASPQVLYLEDVPSLTDPTIGGNLTARATTRNLAYVIYTSGSTGTPKGVMIEQRGMINHLFAKIDTLQLCSADRVAQTASQCFDISVWQFLAALLIGGSIHIFSDDVAHHPRELLKQVEQQQISILETVPSLLRAVLEAVESGRSDTPRLELLRWLVPTGEALPPALCERWLRAYPRIPLLNAYGPTECSDDVTHYPIYQPLPETFIHTPIGRPISNMKMYILNHKLSPLPVGVSGELYVGGIGVGRGYLNDPLRTAEAFVADPFSNEPGMRLYKTGDLARYLPDGNIVFLGRIDHQVKIRGNRIELGEIEAILHQHPDVEDVVVIAREDTPGDKFLTAYIATSTSVTTNNLRNYLKDKLPDYMVPSAFMLLEALPLTSNGKIDRRALPIPERTGTEMEETFVAPVLPVHKQLIEIWEDLLDVRPIGIRDNFFELGGHSLLAIRLVDRIEQVWGKKIPPATLVNGATIEQLADFLVQPEEVKNSSKVAQAANYKRSSSEARPLLSSIKTLWTKSRLSNRLKN